MDKKDVVLQLMKHDVLLSPELLDKLSDENLILISEKLKNSNAVVLTSDVQDIINQTNNSSSDLNWVDFENGKVQKEKGNESAAYDGFLNFAKNDSSKNNLNSNDSNFNSTSINSSSDDVNSDSSVLSERKSEESVKNNSLVSENVVPKRISRTRVVYSYDKLSEKRSVQDFVAYYNKRYRAIQTILSSRQELQNITSISRVLSKKDKENIAVIGMVTDIKQSKKGNFIITLEDTTGVIKAIVSQAKPELYEAVKDLVLDEVVGCTGVNGDKIIFSNNIIWPDIPLLNEKKRSPDEAYAIFLSDVHIGSKDFLPDEFNRFLNWISGKSGNDAQKNIASKIKYVFIIGDLVDGVGIYPNQESELVLADIYAQYEEAIKLLSRIPEDIDIIICPGNHDVGRIAEPQLKLGSGFSESLSRLPNVTLVSNPSLINIHESDDFPGFNVLMYHGYSFDHYVASVDSIRTGGGYDRADLIMKFLLQRRHLAPTQGSTLYIPDTEHDPLVISSVPDFFVTGHIHKTSVASYRGVTMICGSCWQALTSFQEKVGHHPEPARVPVVNLQNREIKIMRF